MTRRIDGHRVEHAALPNNMTAIDEEIPWSCAYSTASTDRTPMAANAALSEAGSMALLAPGRCMTPRELGG